jgi:hypothetical protein
MHLLFVGRLQDEGNCAGMIADESVLQSGYLEKLFLKESIEQGNQFDAPESIAKIVFPFPHN